MKECKKCGSEDVAKVGEIYIKEVEYDCPDCGTGFLIQEDRIRDRLYTQKEVDQIRQEERKKTLEEVRVKVGNKSAKVIGKLNNRQYDYGLGVVRCVGILSEVISKITKRGK